MVASANVVHKAEGLPGSLKLAMKLHYFANIKYPDSVIPLYGVLEAFSKLPISVSLGALAKKVIAENKLTFFTAIFFIICQYLKF